MRGPAVFPIVIAAGGTGGHFFPAEALATELLARGRRVALMTDARSGGLRSPVFAGLERFVISGAGIAGRGPLRAGKATLALAAGVLQARRHSGPHHTPPRWSASAAIPCVAPVLATRLMRHRPTVILHEQNAVLGRANRFLSGHADRLALSFAATSRVPKVGTLVTGNPVRPAIAALATLPYAPPTDTVRLLVLGGSLGARVFSDVVPTALARCPMRCCRALTVVQQCRAEDLGRVRAAYDLAGIAAELAPFFPDVAERLAVAHLVIARAGASTVAELAIAGRPAILVPLPGAIDDHQSANARALAEARGASVIAQRDLRPEVLRDASPRCWHRRTCLHTRRGRRAASRVRMRRHGLPISSRTSCVRRHGHEGIAALHRHHPLRRHRRHRHVRHRRGAAQPRLCRAGQRHRRFRQCPPPARGRHPGRHRP